MGNNTIIESYERVRTVRNAKDTPASVPHRRAPLPNRQLGDQRKLRPVRQEGLADHQFQRRCAPTRRERCDLYRDLHLVIAAIGTTPSRDQHTDPRSPAIPSCESSRPACAPHGSIPAPAERLAPCRKRGNIRRELRNHRRQVAHLPHSHVREVQRKTHLSAIPNHLGYRFLDLLRCPRRCESGCAPPPYLQSHSAHSRRRSSRYSASPARSPAQPEAESPARRAVPRTSLSIADSPSSG